MFTLYTAIGRFERRTDSQSRQYPAIIIGGKEYVADMEEMILWISLYWRISDAVQMEALYEKRVLETGVAENMGFAQCAKCLERRGLIVSGTGESGADALYDLLCGLYILPVRGDPIAKLLTFLKLLLRGKGFLRLAREVFRTEPLNEGETRIMSLVKQSLLSTAEIVKCVEMSAHDLSSGDKVMETLYNNDYTTCDNIASDALLMKSLNPVITSIANLYLRRQIIFERI